MSSPRVSWPRCRVIPAGLNRHNSANVHLFLQTRRLLTFILSACTSQHDLCPHSSFASGESLHNQKSILEIERKYHRATLVLLSPTHSRTSAGMELCHLSLHYWHHHSAFVYFNSICFFISKKNKRTKSFGQFFGTKVSFFRRTERPDSHKIFARQDHFRTKFKSQDYPADVASWQDMAAPLSQTQNLQTPSVQTED